VKIRRAQDLGLFSHIAVATARVDSYAQGSRQAASEEELASPKRGSPRSDLREVQHLLHILIDACPGESSLETSTTSRARANNRSWSKSRGVFMRAVPALFPEGFSS